MEQFVTEEGTDVKSIQITNLNDIVTGGESGF